ncbi:MAG: type II toxin-antitoxin system prevent-host-death family antitoxin [Rubrobacter sp.]
MELKARLSEYLLRVRAGEVVLVTDRGKPVARLVPVGAGYEAGLEDAGIVVWWATRVECVSAISRRAGEGALDPEGEAAARDLLDDLSGSWTEVQPSVRLRALAKRILVAHPLRATDALQLASALIWCGEEPRGRPFVCLDERLRAAASRSGFDVLPNQT